MSLTPVLGVCSSVCLSVCHTRELRVYTVQDIEVNFVSCDRAMFKLNTRGVAEYSDFGHIERYISETVQNRSYICINH